MRREVDDGFFTSEIFESLFNFGRVTMMSDVVGLEVVVKFGEVIAEL